MAGMVRVEAVIPTAGRRAAWLTEAVESCLASPAIGRVVVSGDARSSGHPRVELIGAPGLGPGAARNRGCERVRAEFVLFLDDDDALESGGIEPMLALADQLGAGAVVSGRNEVDGEGAVRRRGVPPELAGRVVPNPGDVFRPIPIFGGSGVLVRRTLLAAGLAFDEGLLIGEDRDFLRRAAERTPVAVCGAAAIRVRVHSDAAHLTSPDHLERRASDLLVLVRRYQDSASQSHLREQTRWLLSALARHGQTRSRGWRELAAEATGRGWSVPLRARLRVLARALVPHA
jgi:glycosyltransferase involved in cell wall biosynthesis